MNRPAAIASTTKLMTALVTLEHVRNLQTVFTQNNYRSSAVDSQLGLVPGERMTVRDLLLAMLLPSADDAAEDLAYNVGHGSLARFVGHDERPGRPARPDARPTTRPRSGSTPRATTRPPSIWPR